MSRLRRLRPLIAFLDSDDLWRSNKLSVQIPLLESSEACLIFSAYDVFRGGGRQLGRTVAAPERLVYRDLLGGDPIGCLTAIYDTKKTGKVLMPDIRMRQDWGLWLRLLRGGAQEWGAAEFGHASHPPAFTFCKQVSCSSF
jgi:hypothetical protein